MNDVPETPLAATTEQAMAAPDQPPRTSAFFAETNRLQ